MAKDAKNQPNATGVAHEKQRDAVEICRDVFDGTLTLRAKKQKYLPQFPKESDGDYEARRKQAVLFNAFRRTVRGLSGMVFRKDPVLSDNTPENIQEDAKNIDLTGRELPVFLKDVFDAALTDGHSHIFVDLQRLPNASSLTLMDDKNLGVRPYWVHILKMQVLRFRTINIGGRTVLSHFAYAETTTEPDGEFGEKEVQRVREYRLGTLSEDGKDARRVVLYVIWKLEKNDKGEDEWRIESSDHMDIGRIPLTTVYAERDAFMVSTPPLLDLALENIGHYQVRSDRRNSLHIAGVPIPITIGLRDDETMPVGSSFGISLPLGGDAKYLEPTGASLNEMREELRDIEQRMAALGLAMLQRDTRAAETAEARRIEKSETDSSLSTAARLLSAAATEALSFHAEWLDLDEGGELAVNRDFESQLLDPAMIRELRGMVADGQLSLDTMWDILEQGELLPDTFDAETERDRLSNAEAELSRRARQPGDDPANPPRRQPQPA